MTPRIFFPLSGLLFVARYFVALCSNTHNKLKSSHVLLTFQAITRYCRDLQTNSNMFCIIRAPSQTQSQRIVIHLARNADKGGGVLMSIILPNLNHSFISPVPDSGSGFRFRIPISWFSIRPYPSPWVSEDEDNWEAILCGPVCYHFPEFSTSNAWNLVYKQSGDWVKFGVEKLFLLPVQPKWVVSKYGLHYRTSDRKRREIMACVSILQYRNHPFYDCLGNVLHRRT